ncbi:hypothetical protein DASC09_011080 [Saccharomycopsis crataegensis]|uniref:Uncharacterized protein n=1 Tax=Saccharomycopsis crataegensis TaxID=43959 RepID=A0AAV5QG30_9ASCO|nr:hypothetical protein DASC09_011080 [Saccharomycopsis crataegensis]
MVSVCYTYKMRFIIAFIVVILWCALGNGSFTDGRGGLYNSNGYLICESGSSNAATTGIASAGTATAT